MTGRRVVVTGLGPVTPIGVGAEEFHKRQLEGVGGTRTLTRFPAGDLPVHVAGEVDLPDELSLPARDAVRTDRCAQFALAAAELALMDGRVDLEVLDRDRAGVAIGSGCGGAASITANAGGFQAEGFRGVSGRFIPMSMANSPAASVAIRHGLRGPCGSPVTACASGSDALVAAHQMITSGEADLVLAGGSEAPLTGAVLSGFARMKALSRRNADPAGASRPFSEDRDGFVLGEGAAVLVLEDAAHAAGRGAAVLAELRGYGRSCDAHHIVAPRPDGAVAARALAAALRSAGLEPADVSCVNAHGTGTPFNDAAEAAALHRALGPAAASVPVTATKSMTGHALGASGAIEAVAAVQTIVSGIVPPTANHTHPDRTLGLRVIDGAESPRRMPAVLSNSFAFGGHNVVLVFTAPADRPS